MQVVLGFTMTSPRNEIARMDLVYTLGCILHACCALVSILYSEWIQRGTRPRSTLCCCGPPIRRLSAWEWNTISFECVSAISLKYGVLGQVLNLKDFAKKVPMQPLCSQNDSCVITLLSRTEILITDHTARVPPQKVSLDGYAIA